MKKIIALFAIMLAFGYSANAQQKNTVAKAQASQQVSQDEANIEKAAVKDVAAMSEYIQLTDNQKAQFKGLFEHKYRELAQNLSQERKDILANSIEAKLNASLTPDQQAKLESNPKLKNILIH